MIPLTPKLRALELLKKHKGIDISKTKDNALKEAKTILNLIPLINNTHSDAKQRWHLIQVINEIKNFQIRNKMNEEILEAKRRLYLLLMKLDEDTITDNEVDIMFLLSKDEQIQSLFQNANKK